MERACCLITRELHTKTKVKNYITNVEYVKAIVKSCTENCFTADNK